MNSQVCVAVTSMIRHAQLCGNADENTSLRSFSSSNVQTKSSSTLSPACAHEEHFVNGQRCNFPGMMSCKKAFKSSSQKNSRQAPAFATNTNPTQHFRLRFFKPRLSTQRGRRASTASSEAVERIDMLPGCVLPRCSSMPTDLGALCVGSSWVEIQVMLQMCWH